MKKIVGIIVVLAIIVGIGGLVLVKSAGKIIQTAVVRLGPEIAQIDIELEKVNISFLSGAGGLEGLKVHNPGGGLHCMRGALQQRKIFILEGT